MDLIERILSIFWPMKQRPATELPVSDPANPAAPAVAPIGGQADPASRRAWRLTYYYISDQASFSGPAGVPVYDIHKNVLNHVEPGFFAQMSLEGTGKLRGGAGLLNVAGTNVAVSSDDYAPVWEYHKKYLSHRDPGYSGLVVKDDKVVAAAAYARVPQDALGKGYGILRGIPMEPFRTLAADLGFHKKDDPRFKGKGGLVPALSKVFIKEFVGLSCPDGEGGHFVHDGWFTVNDTGGGIFGAHFDVFVGTKALAAQVKIPSPAHIWFEKIEERVPVGYSLGLVDG